MLQTDVNDPRAVAITLIAGLPAATMVAYLYEMGKLGQNVKLIGGIIAITWFFLVIKAFDLYDYWKKRKTISKLKQNKKRV